MCRTRKSGAAAGQKKKADKVNTVESDDEYAFTVRSTGWTLYSDEASIKVMIEGVPLHIMLIDL